MHYCLPSQPLNYQQPFANRSPATINDNAPPRTAILILVVVCASMRVFVGLGQTQT